MTDFKIGDLVKVKEKTMFGTKNPTPTGLKRNKIYCIIDVHKGIDGAYDWDSIFLEGIPVKRYSNSVEGQFCEFDFELLN